MKNLALLLILTLFFVLSGCSQDGKDKVQGEWNSEEVEDYYIFANGTNLTINDPDEGKLQFEIKNSTDNTIFLDSKEDDTTSKITFRNEDSKIMYLNSDSDYEEDEAFIKKNK